jgi:hypothetical protein
MGGRGYEKNTMGVFWKAVALTRALVTDRVLILAMSASRLLGAPFEAQQVLCARREAMAIRAGHRHLRFARLSGCLVAFRPDPAWDREYVQPSPRTRDT